MPAESFNFTSGVAVHPWLQVCLEPRSEVLRQTIAQPDTLQCYTV